MVQSHIQRVQDGAQERERELLVETGVALAATLDADEMLTRLTRLLVRDLADFCVVELADRLGGLRRRRVLHRDPGKVALCETFARCFLGRQGGRAGARWHQPDTACLIARVSPRDLLSMAEDQAELRNLRELMPRSVIFVPLLAHGEAFGALVLASSAPAASYRERDFLLAQEIAGRAALAFENARLYAEAWAATQDLRDANEQLVKTTIRAQELAEEADGAKRRAEESERELREAAQLREMFIGILGHDLRNPLAAVSMFASSLLQHGRLTEESQKKVLRISVTTTRMARMISQLLDLTRARFGQGFPLSPAPADLREICRGVTEELGLGIRLETEGDLRGTWDADRVTEALSNIAGNAIEHAAPGTKVVVRVRSRGPDVLIEVVNRGEPIADDVLPHIFEPFRRAKHGRKSANGNLGLGLYISKHIAEASGGSLAASSARGRTTFVMRLPRHPPSDGSAESILSPG